MSFLQRYIDLTDRVKDAVKDAMENEMAAEVKSIMQDQTERQVYAYDASPMAMATRRMDNGGLGDKRNMVHQVTRTDFSISSGGAGLGEIELTVENVTPFQFPAGGDTSLAQAVEEGRKEYKQPYPRPFIAGTRDVAVSSGAARRALEDGLRRRGF